ncbi:MAG: rhodanese-related sulfurtransferase [Candidatus Melainabacteria bacterium]|nr:rhodanese-related sulfurtransferase [Candidatus Melainabacteria bacterium]
MTSCYHVLAYYYFTSIEDAHAEVAKHSEFIRDKDIRCRVYISSEGINGQMSASPEESARYQEWLKSDPRFKDVVFKVHYHSEHVFPRATVKYRNQIVALDEKVDIALTGEHLSPDQWKEMLAKKDDTTMLLDVRNDYEWEIGHFEGAELPKLEKFREFPKYARELSKSCDPKETKVMMYCTGGIRCELYSALLKREGFENVYQLDGGVINYGLKQGHDHWRGKLFVFDDRLAVPIDDKNEEVISQCRHCGVKSDVYYNCANMDCNDLFLCCPSCAEKLQGCCCEECQTAPRLRPYDKAERPKPFRRATET